MVIEQTVPGPLRVLVRQIAQAGGKVLLVGGAVIDAAQGREPKDWDLEVYRLDFDDLERVLADYHPNIVGKAFGTMKVTLGDIEVDINIPRTDNKVGAGHKGISVTMDSSMTVKEAARRRDFTINSMALDLETGEFHDPYHGREDLENGVLRMVDPTTFVEDPLRALRGMQLLARKARTVDPATMRLVQSMVHTFPELPPERVHGEFVKLMTKAPKPSVGLNYLRESGWLVHFPELEAMIGCEQRTEWHPEGDVWTHSLLAADAAAEVLPYMMTHTEEQREAFLFGVFLHDIGKPLVTITKAMIDARDPRVLYIAEENNKKPEDMWLTAYGHDVAGMDPAETFMRRLTNNTKTIALVRGIVCHHMQPSNLLSGKAQRGGYARLHRKMLDVGGDLAMIGRMNECDACASGGIEKGRSLKTGGPNWEHEASARVLEYAAEFTNDNSAVAPKVMGRDLIALGMKPGTEFGRILKAALELQYSDSNLSKEEILTAVLPAPGR